MDTHGNRTRPDTPPNGLDVRIEATNFGPIASAAVDLRPLTVFVGPSNTGKTYFAVLIYALHRVLEGFGQLPSPYRHEYRALSVSGRGGVVPAETVLRHNEFHAILDKLDADTGSFRLSDVPERARDAARTFLMDPEMLRAELEWEFIRCFDVESTADLVRLSERRGKMGIALAVKDGEKNLWGFRAGVSESEVTADGRLEEDVVLLSDGDPRSRVARYVERRLRPKSRQEIADSELPKYPIEEFLDEVLFAVSRSAELHGSEAHYLPAARSGIMQSHRVIASSLVERSTRAGLERFPELPTFSGIISDFMKRLILYEESESGDRAVREVAERLEQETLVGQVQISRPAPGGYPEFVYRPSGTNQDVRLTRASSMVSELAPVVLFLRSGIAPGDTLVIEEPEAHLHPAAQTSMAVALARLVRAGVRVVVTTHSDWLLKEIGNLMRAGALTEAGRPPGDDGPPSALRRDEVGIWLFRKDGPASGSTVEEIPFDPVEGVEPRDYEDVAEALYNRAADLQNQLEDVKGGGRESE